MADRNLALPGNPRYQPKALQDYFGYDNLYRTLAMVELANLDVLAEIGVMPESDHALLTPEVVMSVLEIATTDVDAYERAVTKHDVRAWVHLAQERMDPRVGRWLHVPLTSYDPLDTGRILQFALAYDNVVRPAVLRAIGGLADVVEEHASTIQIGRTHGQHALPITAGFWLATILSRWVYNFQQMEVARDGLVGKISGAVGASNALRGLGIDTPERCGDTSYEQRVLDKLNLRSARISTQILPPEPLAYFLFAAAMMSASIAQFGRDGRNLMRTEIGEFTEPFSSKQVGSSTMAQKRNPINFEGIEGGWWRTKNEFGKVLDTMLSEHQRDLVGSSVARDYATIIVNLQNQLDTLLRSDKEDPRPFIARVRFSPERLEANFFLQADVILAEPMYIALQMAGYEGDAHELVNRTLVPTAMHEGWSLVYTLEHQIATGNQELADVWQRVPEDVRALLDDPERYTGNASEKALAIAGLAREVAAQ